MRKIFQLVFILCAAILFSQNKEQKIEYILKTSKTLEGFKSLLIEMRIDPLKNMTSKADSLKIIEIEKNLTDEEILKRLSKGFSETFNDAEIDDIYKFYNTSAGKKMVNNYENLERNYQNNFKDIFDELGKIMENVNQKNQEEVDKNKEDPVAINKEDGFYFVVNKDESSNLKLKDFKLSANPAIKKSDILAVKKISDDLGRFAIDFILTQEGASKFKILTENNLRKPIAIVLNKMLVSAPIVQSVIPNGRIQISGNFTEKEVDDMIENFQKK